MDDEKVVTETQPETPATPEVSPEVEEPKPAEPEAVPVNPPETMQVSMSPVDPNHVESNHPVRAIRIHALSGRQLVVVKTDDTESCLHIYVDVA